MTDKLEEIWNKQFSLDEYVAEKNGLVYPWHLDMDFHTPEDVSELRAHWIKESFNAFDVEKAEVMDELQYKWWKNYAEPINWDKVQKELIDCFHFMMKAMQAAGMTADDIHRLYVEKNDENVDRQDGKVKGREDYGK